MDLKKILENHRIWLCSNKKDGKKANLEDADLEGVDLSGADLRGAELRGADLRGADLKKANLEDADLEGANLEGADLRGANLKDADLEGTNLREVDLRGADLKDAYLKAVDLVGTKTDYRIQPGLLKQIANLILCDNSKLEMARWHSDCGTTHCLAGWACILNGEVKNSETVLGTWMAGRLALGEEAASYFYKSNNEVLEWLKTI